VHEESADQAAIDACLAGDPEAFGPLVSRYQEVAFRAAYLVVRDADAARDVAQEAFVRTYRSLRRFEPGSNFRPWLLRIVTNLALNETRRRKRGLALLERFGREPPRGQPGPETLTMATEEAQTVWQAINRLPPDDRLVLYLRYFLELSEADMARVIDRAPGTVKSRLHRAGRRLRDVIEKDYPHLRTPDD
jgi:RNA polymerase sigma-70 factor (ECF subfamily)